jgi:biopolymer transport protein ExbD
MPELPAASPAPLSAAQRSKIRRLAAEERGEEAGAELNVVPYMDVVMNLTMFVLATVSVIFVSSVETRAAALNPGRPYQPATLGLTVLVTEQGVSMKTAAGNVATGCGEGGSGIAVPKRDGQQDLPTVTACARRLKAARAEFAAEREVALSASPGVEYQTVLAVMDALRHDGDAELFPEVRLAIVR